MNSRFSVIYPVLHFLASTLVQSQQFRVASASLGQPSEARLLSREATQSHCSVLRRSYLHSEDCGHTGHLPPSGFLVTGTGRSGTKFLVKVLNALGLQVSHDNAKQRSADGAVSWVHGNHKRGCQLPWWSYNVSDSFFSEVFLMLRDPLDQISSRSENGNLERREWYDFLSCSSRMNDEGHDVSGPPGPPSGEEDSDVVRSLKTALKFYVLQNSFIEEYAAKTFRVEDLREDPQILMDICSRNHSCNCSFARVTEVMKEVGDKVNSNHTNKTSNVTWSRLAALDRPFAVMAQILAQRHGYVLPKEDVLPEAAFGFSCGFDGPDEETSRWTCKLNSEGKRLLEDQFSLSKLAAAKDSQRHCHLQSAQLKRSIVTLSISMAGSGSGMTDELDELCQVPQVLANGAGHVLVPLRHPLARLLTGFQQAQMVQFNTLNQFLDSLRNSSEEKHQLALDLAYRPGRANFLLPLQFYLGDSVPSSERQRRVVSFICRCRMEEELKRISQSLHVDVDFSGLEKPEPDDAMLYDAMLPGSSLSSKNRAWFLAEYAADLALYQEHCSACSDARDI